MGSYDIPPSISESWIQTSTGIWSRPFTAWDESFIALIRRESTYAAEGLMIISSIKIAPKQNLSQSELVHRLRQAWQTMRYYYPIHGFHLDLKNRQMIYKTPNTEELDKWTDETFAVQDHTTAQEVLRDMLKSPKLVYCSQTGEVVYAIGHLLSDALGVVNFWQKFLEFVDVPEEVIFGDEHKFLAPPTEELIGCPKESNPELDKMVERFLGRSMDDMQNTAQFKDQGLDRPATKTYSMCFTYNQKTTSSIIKACKNKGWTVTSAVSAAMAGAFFKRKDLRNPEASVLSTLVSHNYQQYINPEVIKAYPQVNTTTMFTISIHKGPFDAMANECSKFYKRGMVFDDINLLECTAAYMTSLIDVAKTPSQEIADVPYISSLGLLDRKLSSEFQNFHVRDFRLGNTMTLPGTLFHVWTFAGELCVNCSWQEAWEEEERVYSYSEEMRTTLLEGLGVMEE